MHFGKLLGQFHRYSGNCARIIKPREAACDAAGDYHGVEVRYYDLLPDKGWQCNIGDIAKLVDPASADLFLTVQGTMDLNLDTDSLNINNYHEL